MGRHRLARESCLHAYRRAVCAAVQVQGQLGKAVRLDEGMRCAPATASVDWCVDVFQLWIFVVLIQSYPVQNALVFLF
jgi:hypothetical protein